MALLNKGWGGLLLRIKIDQSQSIDDNKSNLNVYYYLTVTQPIMSNKKNN